MLDQIMDKKIQEDEKAHCHFLKGWDQKQGIRGKGRVLYMPACTRHPQKGGQAT